MKLFRTLVMATGLLLLSASAPLGLAPRLQPVAVSAGQLPGLAGQPRERLALMVWVAGGWQPAPFQVDPADASGYLFGSATLTGATPPGPLGALDEIAFMASDLGEHSEAAPGPGPAWEVEVSVGDEKRYGYLWLAPGTPPRSKADYVAYQRDPSRESIATPRYIQSFAPEAAFYSDLAVLPPDGNGRDMYDRLKLRSKVTTVGGVEVRYSEADFHSRVTGVRDGPVRVIRQNRTSLDVLLGLKTPEALVNEIFWRDSFEVPSELSLPYGANLVISKFDYYQGCDLNRAVGPFTFQADVGGPVAVDGRMTPAEKAMTQSNQDHRWGMVSGQAGSVFYIAEWFERSAPVKLRLYYMDDATMPDGPENEPGQSMYGIRLENGLKLAGAGQKLNFRVFILPAGTSVEEAKGLLGPVKVRISPINHP